MRVLVIEDNEQNLYLVRFILERAGHVVECAMDSYEGIALAARVKPDLILLDIQLPSMDGYAVAQRIRSLAGLEKTPMVAVTSYAMPGDKEKALESGCDGYIEKPIDPDSFLSQVELYFSIAQSGG